METSTSENCPFCAFAKDRILERSKLALATTDAFPVSPGHTLVVPVRHFASWFEASDEEREAIVAMTDRVKAFLDEKHRPDGYNLGINVGRAAGQTVFHLHVHVIPRYEGDMTDPRGGVRHVIPDKGNYFTSGQ